MNMKNITIVGAGYVGLSMAILLARKYSVKIIDVLPEKIDKINRRISPFQDEEIERYLSTENLYLTATNSPENAYSEADYIIIATPTDYDVDKMILDVSSVESVIDEAIKYNRNATFIIKSTIPIGYTEHIRDKHLINKILFCPEFLRESKALHDSLSPDRIVVGVDLENISLCEIAYNFAEMLRNCVLVRDIPILIVRYDEAESIKLFSNAYLALRVAFFNELDTFSESRGMSARNIIDGVCLDKRIGNYYNNPSFGYGGYCLPKDTKQLLTSFGNISQSLIGAIINSNELRKKHVVETVLQNIIGKTFTHPIVGIYRINAKLKSDNFRNSAVLDVIETLKNEKVDILIYEPLLYNQKNYLDCKVIENLSEFKRICTIIVANRYDSCLNDVSEKVYTRDIFGND